MEKLKTLIVAGDELRLPLLAARLELQPALCVTEVESDTKVAALSDGIGAEAVVYEVCPCGAGLERFLTLLQRADRVPPLVVLGDSHERILPILRSAPRLPAWGFVAYDAAPSRIVAALHAVRSGLFVSDSSLCGGPSPTDDVDPLTPRERDVLRLMADGQPNKRIATQLGISLHTAKFHVARVLVKLRSASRTEAVAEGARRGLITL